MRGRTYISSKLFAQILSSNFLRNSLVVKSTPKGIIVCFRVSPSFSLLSLLKHEQNKMRHKSYLQSLLIIDIDELLVSSGRVGDVNLCKLYFASKSVREQV